MKKKKLNKVKVKRCAIFLIVILIFICIICYRINKKNNQYKELTILMDNELIELINDVIIDNDENIFFSKEDVKDFFDDTIYYNEVEKELITTNNKHIALLKVDELYAEINDETVELNGKLQEIEKKVYLPITDLAIVYDLDIEYSKTNNRIIIDHTTNKKVEANVQKKTKIKKNKGLFSRKIEKLIIGDKVTIIENVGKYSKVRTKAGNIGYIKTNKLSNEKEVRENEKVENKEIEVYRNYSNISGVYDNLEVNSAKLNVVIPTFFYMDKNDKVLDKTMSTTATYSIYKNWTDINNLEILPSFNNNESVSSCLLSYSQRSKIINSLKESVINYNYMGINIAFDTIDDVNSFYRFILELVPRFKEKGLKVVVTLNNNLDKTKLKGLVDYIIEK